MRDVGLGVALVPFIIALAYMWFILLINRKSYGVQKFNEFATGSGAFGIWFITFSLMATWYTGASYTAWMGMAVSQGLIYLYGAVYGIYGVIVLYFGSEKFWYWGQKYGVNSQAELWGLRYGSEKVKLIVGIIGVISSFPWLILEFWTLGFLINYSTYKYVPFFWAMLIGVVVTAYYVSRGGMKAVVTANFIQGVLFLAGAIFFTYIITYMNTGGLGDTFKFAFKNYPEMLTFPGPGWAVEPKAPYWTSIILTSSLGGFSWPWVMNRVFAADSVKSVRRASWQCCAFVWLVCMFGFFLYGLSVHQFDFAREYFQESWIWFADKMLGPVGVTIALLIALSAVLGTISSLIHYFGVAISNDIIMPINKKLTDEKATRYAQYFVVLISSIAFIMANMNLPNLIYIALLMYQFIIQFFPGQVLGVYWKRGNKYGAVIGLIAGFLVTLFLTIKDISGLGFNGWTPGMFGIAVNVLIYVVLGFVIPVDEKTNQLFDETEKHQKDLRNGVSVNA